MKQLKDFNIQKPESFPNKFCERPLFVKESYYGQEIDVLKGYIRWHSDNEANKIKIMLGDEQLKKEDNLEWDNNKRKTKGMIEKELFFEALKNNKIGQKFVDDKIVDFIKKEDKNVRLMF